MDVYKNLCIIAVFTIALLIGTILDRNVQISRIYNTLSSRCVEPSHFDKDTLSCVITYQVP